MSHCAFASGVNKENTYLLTYLDLASHNKENTYLLTYLDLALIILRYHAVIC